MWGSEGLFLDGANFTLTNLNHAVQLLVTCCYFFLQVHARGHHPSHYISDVLKHLSMMMREPPLESVRELVPEILCMLS